ncbi:hypothetical protein GUITHDRAFT_135781 [Guillardia theta CCMP2712]|uniref:Uncharacterized protein n=1 Tax=Guillardia theta (strain CCMP2712) TaxID=905079 RepID=L1JMT9_GUITC|nr:hypothetical protein GUITHDRAFT_135781 [Guillardia theta CCMP2712]EKX49589.1 hypothetical protein GUITHDRAFT_135781 [Guillardia theta CCMP2712]|eukprot:XP_005836569.1 hypothetical protein GUITHDRAFT_135781 [Guillardia theta CCMP2712]
MHMRVVGLLMSLGLGMAEASLASSSSSSSFFSSSPSCRLLHSPSPDSMPLSTSPSSRAQIPISSSDSSLRRGTMLFCSPAGLFRADNCLAASSRPGIIPSAPWRYAATRPAIVRSGGRAMKMSQQADELLITRPRTSNCWYGVFFDLVSKSGKLKIHDIQSGCSSLAQDVELDLQVWKCTKGSFLGNENDPSAWKCLGKRKQVMNVIEFEQGEFTIKTELYKSFPLDEPVSDCPAVFHGHDILLLTHARSLVSPADTLG